MTKFAKILAAAAAIGICSIAAPAAAQPAEDPGALILQGVIDGLLGNRYNVTDRRAVRRCTNAALAEAWDEFGPRRRDRRDRRGWNPRSQMRVVAITDVDRRPAGLRVRGEIDSGLLYAQRYPGDRHNRMGDLSFRCNVDYNGRIYNVRVDRNSNFRPY